MSWNSQVLGFYAPICHLSLLLSGRQSLNLVPAMSGKASNHAMQSWKTRQSCWKPLLLSNNLSSDQCLSLRPKPVCSCSVNWMFSFIRIIHLITCKLCLFYGFGYCCYLKFRRKKFDQHVAQHQQYLEKNWCSLMTADDSNSQSSHCDVTLFNRQGSV